MPKKRKIIILIFSLILIIVTICCIYILRVGLRQFLIKQGVYGVVAVYNDCMMHVDRPCDPAYGIKTDVYITKMTPQEFNKSLLIKSAKTAKDGHFKTSLPVGDYSLFIKTEKGIICRDAKFYKTGYMCNPFSVTENQLTEINTNFSVLDYYDK